MKLVEQYGSVFRLTNKEYKEMLEGIATGGGYQLGNELGIIEARPLNMTAEQAEEELRDLRDLKSN